MRNRYVRVGRWSALGSFAVTAGMGIASLALFDSVGCTNSKRPPPVGEEYMPTAPERVADITRRVQASPNLARFHSAESVAREIERDVVGPWRRAWTERDATAFRRLVALGARLPAWAAATRSVRREIGGISELSWTPDTATAGDETGAFLAGFAGVEFGQFDVVRCLPADDAAVLDVRFDLRGTASDGRRRQDRGLITIGVVRNGGRWRITDMQVAAPLETLLAARGRRPAFEVATTSAGLDVVPRVDRGEAIRRGGYALAVSDYDGDGAPDLLVGNSGPVQLFRNTGHGYVDVSHAAGLHDETLVKSAAFADLDRDGLPDLVLARFVDSNPDASTDHLDGRDGEGDIVFYRNLGEGRFERRGNVLSHRRRYDRSMPLAIADFDGNGTLDIYVGFPGVRDFTNDLARTGGRTDLAHEGLWLNRGDWRFSEAPMPGGAAQQHRLFPHAALATDLTGDGRPEIIVIDDSGNVSPVYLNHGDGTFRPATHELGLDVEGWWGMSAAAGDYDGDGANDLLITGVSLVPGTRAAALLNQPDAEISQETRQLLSSLGSEGIRLFHNRGDGTFEDSSARAGVGWAGAAPAGAEWIDYDNDGLLDLYVANGLWSGGPEDADSLFVQLVLDRSFRDRNIPDLAMSLPGAAGRAANPMLMILRDFRGTLSNPMGAPVSDLPTLSLAGYQRNRLFRNNGDGTFTEVGYLENADRIEDGYMAVAVDVDRDGVRDLILRNADAPPTRSFAPVVYLHGTGTAGRSVHVRLQGTGDNTEGVGARVSAVVGERTLVREVRSVNGASQAEPGAFFGLGESTRVQAFSVRWPSGMTEAFAGAAAGEVTLRQGTGVTVTSP